MAALTLPNPLALAGQQDPVRVEFARGASTSSRDSGIHLLHRYPAKLIPSIPRAFLSLPEVCPPRGIVLDPFCGSGTVLVEAIRHGCRGIGAESNPLARLITEVKTRRVNYDRLRTQVVEVLRRARRFRSVELPDVVNLDYWFPESTSYSLATIRRALDELEVGAERDFLRLCLSATVNSTALTDPKVSVPVRLNPRRFGRSDPRRRQARERLRLLRDVDVYGVFQKRFETNLDRHEGFFRSVEKPGSAALTSVDARKITVRPDGVRRRDRNSVDLVLTSPPYLGAQKYVRFSSLSIGWLGLGAGLSLRSLEDENIGREHFPARTEIGRIKGPTAAVRAVRAAARKNPLRGVIASTYLSEMQAALSEACRVLRPGGHFILIAAENQLCGRKFDTPAYLAHFLLELGLERRATFVDRIRGRMLLSRRKGSAAPIREEHVMVFTMNRED